MAHLDSTLDKVNPGARAVVEEVCLTPRRRTTSPLCITSDTRRAPTRGLCSRRAWNRQSPRQAGHNLTDIAYHLSQIVPFVISTPFYPNGSKHQLNATVMELKDAMEAKAIIRPKLSREEWLTQRS